MIKLLPRNIFRFILLIFIQVFVLNNLQFSGFINPFVYILFILLLPFETPKWLLLIIGFILGITVDLFFHTPGIHASATVFMAFLRPFVLNYFAPRDGYESGAFPRVHYFGFLWFLKYSAILVLAHHIFLFYLEVFRFSDFFITFGRVILSWSLSVFLIVSSQYFIFRR
jgi:rod shape-determining protein MreD